MPFDAIEYINTPRWLTSRLGLERIRELLDRLGRPQDRLKFVHVAGTNGKGSTCAFTASILAEAGFKTGLFTSPYVETFHERIRVNGRNISDEDLTAATLRVSECAEAMEAEGGEHPTEFELMTAVALVHFAHVGCDIVVLEVGLGGRLDSTNVIAASEVAAIVSIALDHTNLLGNTLAEIAHEKAGIVKEGSTVVSWPQEPSAMEVVEDAARRVGDKLVVPDFSQLSVGKVTRGAALLTRGTALEHEGHAPCSGSPRFAAELRAEAILDVSKLLVSSSSQTRITSSGACGGAAARSSARAERALWHVRASSGLFEHGGAAACSRADRSTQFAAFTRITARAVKLSSPSNRIRRGHDDGRSRNRLPRHRSRSRRHRQHPDHMLLRRATNRDHSRRIRLPRRRPKPRLPAT